MTTPTFRSTLAHRILSLLAVSVPAATTQGCFGSCPGPTERTVCVDPASVGIGGEGPGGSGGGGASGGTSSGGGGGGAGGAPMVACPARADALAALQEEGTNISSLTSDGVYDGSVCCYQAVTVSSCGSGRPFLVGGTVRTAGEVRTLSPKGEDGREPGGWRQPGARPPETASLDAATRERLAAEWARDGLFEHASVASFGRFALDLLAAGAPSDLVEDAHRAALDEVRHARLCLSLASRYAGEDIAPGPFPTGASVEVTAHLAALAARCAEEGAIGETVAAVTAAEQLARASDPAVREALAVIAEDEARHAELAWRTVAWAIRTGGAPVRAAVSAVFGRLAPPRAEGAPLPHDERLVAHGRLGEAETQEAAARAIEEIVLPAARLLLATESRSALSEGVASTRPIVTASPPPR